MRGNEVTHMTARINCFEQCWRPVFFCVWNSKNPSRFSNSLIMIGSLFYLNEAVCLSTRDSCTKFYNGFHYLFIIRLETHLKSEKIQDEVFEKKRQKHKNRIFMYWVSCKKRLSNLKRSYSKKYEINSNKIFICKNNSLSSFRRIYWLNII